MWTDLLNSVARFFFYLLAGVVGLFVSLMVLWVVVSVVTTAYLTAKEKFHFKKDVHCNGEPKRKA